MQEPFPTQLDRLRAFAPGSDLSELEAAISASPCPLEVAQFLVQWAKATTNPAVTVPGLLPPLLGPAFRLISWSTYAQNVLVQNPELFDLLLDPQFLALRASRESVASEASRMLDRANSFTHKMDRLRRLKQQWDLLLSLREINGLAPPKEIWQDLSEVADALVTIASQVHWEAYATERGISEPFPFCIAAFGKLGSKELNFSSDIDLVFSLRDNLDPELETLCSRFVVALTRNLSEPMGRGHLYRVDLRLRPFGGTGTVAPRFATVANYYDRYAETWEHLALLRSRVICGPSEEWEALRNRVCFGQQRTAWHIDQVMNQRERLDEFAAPDDLKRGPGGIRDVEFLVHTMQLMFASSIPSLQGRDTAEALNTLGELGILSRAHVKTLTDAYHWLRLLEEFVQIRSNQQVHILPGALESQNLMADLLGLQDRSNLLKKLDEVRDEVRAIYHAIMHPHLSPRAQTKSLFGDLAPAITEWIDRLAEPDAFYEALADSQAARARFKTVFVELPAFVEPMRQSLPLTEWLVTGELLEATASLVLSEGRNYEDARLAAIARAALTGRTHPAQELSELRNQLLTEIAMDLPLGLATLGSHAIGEPLAGSDSDLILFSAQNASLKEAEQAGREFLNRIQMRVQCGNQLAVDFRLRPEGSGGNLVTSWARLKEYRETRMAPWERIALQKYQALNSAAPSQMEIANLIFSAPLAETEFAELLHVKQRLETERGPSNRLRSSPGGLDDIEWILGLTALCDVSAHPIHLHLPTLRRIEANPRLSESEKENLARHWATCQSIRSFCERHGSSVGHFPTDPKLQDLLARTLNAADFTDARNIFHNGIEQTRSTFLRVTASLKQALA